MSLTGTILVSIILIPIILFIVIIIFVVLVIVALSKRNPSDVNSITRQRQTRKPLMGNPGDPGLDRSAGIDPGLYGDKQQPINQQQYNHQAAPTQHHYPPAQHHQPTPTHHHQPAPTHYAPPPVHHSPPPPPTHH